jgi:hypothetical protein
MAWKVVDCRSRSYPWDGEIEGDVYWALLMDGRTGEELEFELLDGVYYEAEDDEEGSGEPLNMIEVSINGAVDFSEVFPLEDKKRIIRLLFKKYGDIIDAINSECSEFGLNFQ